MIGIIGAGPVGSFVAAYLIKNKIDIALCEVSSARREQIAAKGIRIAGDEDFQVEVPLLLSQVEEFSEVKPTVVIIAVKALILPLIASTLQDVLSPGAAIISWQNGIDTEKILTENLPENKVIRAVVNYGVTLDQSGTVEVAFHHPPQYLQETNPAGRETVLSIASLLSIGGIPTERAENLTAMVWKKSILNAACNGLCALTGMNIRQAMHDPYASELADRLLKESIRIARANEIFLGYDFYSYAKHYINNASAHKPSMLQDIELGRRTEVDFLNGKIIEYGERAGIPSPYNSSVFNLIKSKEKTI